jgi:RNA polymerase sigma-70 factor (sigma-E family)
VAEPDGFDEFVAARSARLLRTAYLLVGDWDGAEDLLQTALVRSWVAWRRLNSDPEPYVRKVIVNTYSSWWRRKWNDEHPTADLPDRPDVDVYLPVDERDALWRALRRLPRRQRAVIVLRYFEDQTEAAVAEMLGCSVGTPKKR